ncbi:MAG: hypothetical protein LBJ32_01935 [Oscillospiraceae bacterium]|jgi:hypothetical protein|nr:hypothetical protein [Oscillospiraceae bacterium]
MNNRVWDKTEEYIIKIESDDDYCEDSKGFTNGECFQNNYNMIHFKPRCLKCINVKNVVAKIM